MNSRYRVNLKQLQEAAEAAAAKENVELQVQEYNQLLRKQIDLLNHYCTIKYEELLLEVQNVTKHIKRVTQIASTNKQVITEQELGVILLSSERQLTAAGEDVVVLELCIRENFQLLVKAIAYFDKVVATSSASWFIAQLTRERFANVNSDTLLIALSLCWEKWRILEAQDWDKEKKDTWRPPESFVRNTVKYWLRPEDVARCKSLIIRHCPYLIFGLTSEELEFLIDPYDVTISTKPAPPVGELSDGQLVSSVYFDSEGGYSYQNRVMRYEGAELIRFRWYGENNNDGQLEVFIERKTHHESWSGHDSVKERFSLPQKRVFEFMKGEINLDHWAAHLIELQARSGKPLTRESKKIQNLLKLGTEINASIQEHRLQPMLRTSYLRSAFQRSDRNDIRFSLDTNLCMVDEYVPGNHPQPPWCKTQHEILSRDQIVRFPYAVLEVKLQTEQPQWVSRMLYECHAMMVYKFSKFQHGFAFLHRSKIPTGVPLPHWIEDFENKGYGPGFQVPASQSGSAKKLFSGRSEQNTASFYVQAVYARGRNVPKYDPKSIFACERTLLHYLRKSLFLFAAGLAALQQRWIACGTAALTASIAANLYNYAVYRRRLAKIVNRVTKETYRERLDDLHAPFLATGLVALGLVAALGTQIAARLFP